MLRNTNRVVSVLLVLAMVMSLCSPIIAFAATKDSSAPDWTEFYVDSGMSTASYETSTAKVAPGSDRSLKITAKRGDVGNVALNSQHALSQGQLDKLPDFTTGKVTGWFYFGDQRPMAYLHGIDANWNAGSTGIFEFEDKGDGWYLGTVAASQITSEVDVTNAVPEQMIRVVVGIPGGYTVYVDNLQWEAVTVTQAQEEASDLLSVSKVVSATATYENSADHVSGLDSLYSKKFTGKAGYSGKPTIQYELPQSYDMTHQALSIDFNLRNSDLSYRAVEVSLQDSKGVTVVDALVDNIYWLQWNRVEIDLYKFLVEGKDLDDVKYLTFTFRFDKDTDKTREVYIDNVSITPYETVSSSLNGKSALFLGDSISIAKPFKGYAGLLEERYGMDRTNVSVGGTTFSTIGTQIKGQLSNVPKDAQYDYVILNGGCNDMYLGASSFGKVSDTPITAKSTDFDDTTAIGGLEQMFSMIRRRFPTAKLGYVITYQRADKWLNEYIPEAIKACEKWGVPYLSLPNTDDFIQLFNNEHGAHTTDSVHANVDGYNLVMEHLPQWMETIPTPAAIEGLEPEGPQEEFRGGSFEAAANTTITLTNDQQVEKLSFDYKITSGTKFDLALLCDWSNYYGYFSLGANGANGTYAGVTTQKLSDGYIRVTVDMAAVTAKVAAPDGLVKMLFIRGNSSDAAGEITNIRINGAVGEESSGGQTESPADMLEQATYASSSWNWSGSGVLSYDSKSTNTNGADSKTSWKFSSKKQEAHDYARMVIDLNTSYNMTDKDLVFDIKADPAAELTGYYIGIVPMDSNGEYLHDYTNYKEYQIDFTGDGWNTVTVDNSILKAYLLDGKKLNDVKYLYLSFYFPKGQAQNIYVDNMHMVDHKVGTAATEAASDLLTNATVVENTADGKTYAYEHNNTQVIYGAQSTGSHKFYAAAGATDTFRVKYDLGKSYDLTDKNLVFDMLAYRGSSSFIVTLYNSKNQQISYNVGLTTPNKWAQIRPAVLQGLASGMNLSDVRYIAITARFLDNTSRADRAFYIDNVRFEDIDVHYTALQNKNIVFIGDSITNSYGYKGWSGELEEHYLINRYNIGVGGTSYANIAGRDRIYAQVSKIPNVDVDFFVLNGGVNDIWSNADLGAMSNISVADATVNSFDTNTTAGSMEQMFCYLRTNYPDAQILFVINYICYNSDWNGVRFRDEFTPLAKALCEKWDIPYVDLVNNDSFNASFSALTGIHTYDGVHGNDVGYELVMRQIAPALLAMCGGTEQTEQNSDRLAYATHAQTATNWSGNLSFDNNSTETNGKDSIRSWKFTANSAQTENASILLSLSQMERFDLTDKGIAFDVKFEGGARKIGVQLYDTNWQSLTGSNVIWTDCDGADDWYTVTIGADAVSQLLASGKTLQDVSLVGFTFDFAQNKGKTQTVYVDNFRVVDVKNNATEETEAASDLLYGASFVEGTFGNDGFGYNQKNTSFLKGKDSKYALRLYAADDKTAWATATFKLPKSIDLTDSTLQFDILQKNQAAANVDLYDSDMKLVTSDSYILKDTGWQTFEVNSLFGLASGKTAADLGDIRYIKFSFSFDTAEVGRCIVIDNLSLYENVQYDSMVSGLNGLYLGDSISEAIGFKGWAGEMAEHYGVNGCNVSVSGATLAKNDIFSQLSRVPTGTKVDFVMLNGGVNDVWRSIALGSVSAEGTTQFDTETAIGALEHLFATIQSTYPEAEVFYILNFVCVQPGYPSDAFRNDFAPLARQACTKWNVHCLDLVDNEAFNAEFDAAAGVHTYDGVHPNKPGYDVLTSHIVSFMEDTLFTNDQDPYWVLEQDETVNLSLTEDLYVDLNGHNLSGTIVTNGHAVYAIDATTDKYTCDKMGYFTAVDGNGEAVVPVAHFRSYKNGSVKRYLSIATDNGYTFHRFYVGITKQSLAPSVTGVGYKAVFCGDDMVKAMLDENQAYGYKLWLDGYNPITRSKTAGEFVSGEELTLRIKNFDATNFGETPVHASVWIKLSDGTVIESSQYSVTLRQMVESVNANYKSYAKTQLQATRDMVKANETMLTWQVENILKEEVIRGEAFMVGANPQFPLNTQEALETVSFEYRITDGQKIALAMLCDWNNFYGYFYFNRDGVQGSYAGVTTEKLTDGYIRVTLDIPKLTQLTGNPINVIDSLFIRGAWSDAEGYVDNIQYTVSQGGGEDGGDDQSGVIVNPGASFTAGTTMSIPLVEGTYDTVTFDYKFTGGTKLWFCIGDSTVSKFYGLFKLDGNGVAETYQGISSEVLDNGYIRVTMDLALINRTNHVWNTDNAPATVSTFFLRGDWSDANGVIDNIRCMTADAGGDEEEGGDSGYTEIVTPGGSFEANKGITVNFEAGAYDVVTFDYKITNGGEMQICLLSADWAKYYGYFKFNANGTVQDYAGVSSEKLSNGYIRVTLKLADLGITNWQDNRDNAPETVGILYVRGDISSAAGSVDNIRCLTIDESQEGGDTGYTEIVTPGANVTAGVNQSIYLTEGAYDIVTFDYKFTSGTKMNVALLQADWAKYYGYIKVDANGIVGSYDGVTSEKLSNGYIRVTMELANMTMTNGQNNANNAPKTIALLYVRGDWSDANAVIDNVRCLTKKDDSQEPEAPSDDLAAATKTLYVPQGEEFVILNLSDLQLHDGQDPQYTYDVIRQLVEKTDPDLITVLGDTAQDNRNYPATTNFANLVKYIDSFGIPWAPIFGNHDHDTYSPGYDSPKGVSDAWIMKQFAGAKNCIFMEGPSSVDGCGNYIVHIKEQGTDKLIRALYFFDSLLVGVNETHVQFYRDAVAYTTELNGGKTLESIVFVHIPLPEYATVYTQQLEKDFADTVGTVGRPATDLASGTTEFFKAIKELGSTQNVIAGHDHENAYYITYQGIKLIYNMKSSNGDDYHNVANTGGGVFTIGKTTEFRYERASVTQEVTEATAYIMPLLANWQGSGKGISFTFTATDTVKTGNTISFVLCGSNPRRTSLELKDRHGGWNRLTNSVTIDLSSMTASLGTVTANGDGTYTYSLKLTDAPLNTAASEAAYGDETLKLIYFNSVGRSFKISDLGYVDGTSVPTAPRGEAIVAGVNKTILLENKEALAQISFEYKVTDGQQFNIGLMPDWSNFFGYFSFNAEGNVYAYDGVTTQKLSDGYIRVTMDMAALTKYSGNPSTAIDFLFIRGDWSDANGYIDNVCFLTESEMEQGGNDSGYTEIVTPGANVTAGVSQSIYLTEGAYDVVTFDYKFTSGTKSYVALLQADWAKYYGYIKLNANGVEGNYDGVTYEKLGNGYIRVTMELAKITVTNSANNADNAPETIAQLFVRGDWSDANMTIDNIRCLTQSGGAGDSVPDVIRGEEMNAGLDKQFNFEAKDYEAVIFDYKIGSGEHFWMNLVSPDWSKFYGNFKFDANGEAYDYAGITTEKLSDGYIRVTLLTVEVTRTNSQDNLSNIPATFDKMYIRGDMNTSHGYIDNLQVIEKGDMAYDFTAGKETVIPCREGAYGEVAFTYSIDSGSSFGVALKNPAGDKYYGSFSFNAKGETQDYTGVTTTVLSDGKVNVVIDLDQVNRTGDVGNLSAEPVTVNGLYIQGSATGTVHSAVFTPVEDDRVYRGIPMFAGGDVTLDIGTGVYSQVSFEYCVTNDSDFHVCFIGEDWSHFYGYYNFDADGACLTYPGVSTQKLDDGYVKVTLDIDALTKTNNQENLDGKPSLLKKLYIRGDWSAANGYIDQIRTVAGEREIVRGKEIPASSAIDFSAHAANYASVTLDYKITSGQLKVQLLDDSGNASTTYIFDANGESTDYAGITTSVRGDGYRKITFNPADMTNAPAKVAKVRVLADSTADGYVDNAQFLETETATSAKIAVISDVHLGYDKQGYVDVNRQAQRLERILNNYKLMGVDAVVVTGDLVDHGTLEEKKALMDTFAEIWLRVFPNFTNDLTGEFVQPIIIYGNHDLDLIEANYWPEAFGEFTPGFMTNVNGYYFVGAHYLEEYSATDYIGAAREDSNGNPFFYLQHCDLEGLLYNHTNVDHGSGLTALDDLWNDSNAVTLSGHTHFTSVDERSIWQPSNDDEPRFTSISVPSINYGRVEDTYILNGNREQVVQGLILELEGSQVSITRLSFLDETDTDGEQIGAVWTWDAADPADKPYGYETRAEATAKPVFASGAKISVTKQTATSATISFNAATVNAPAGFSDMVQGYRIAVVDKATGEVVSEQILTTPYHIATDAGSLPTTYQATISDLTAGISYEIRVYAIEFYQVESDPLTLTIKLS